MSEDSRDSPNFELLSTILSEVGSVRSYPLMLRSPKTLRPLPHFELIPRIYLLSSALFPVVVPLVCNRPHPTV